MMKRIFNHDDGGGQMKRRDRDIDGGRMMERYRGYDGEREKERDPNDN